MAYTGPVTLRLADRSDRRALQRLAQLDSRPLPPPPHLVAEREGSIDAALSLGDGEVVANPFRHTAELCELLRRHAAAIEGRAASAPAPPLRARPASVAASA